MTACSGFEKKIMREIADIDAAVEKLRFKPADVAASKRKELFRCRSVLEEMRDKLRNWV